MKWKNNPSTLQFLAFVGEIALFANSLFIETALFIGAFILIPSGITLKAVAWLIAGSWKKNERLIQFLMKEKLGIAHPYL